MPIGKNFIPIQALNQDFCRWLPLFFPIKVPKYVLRKLSSREINLILFFLILILLFMLNNSIKSGKSYLLAEKEALIGKTRVIAVGSW
jgi:hypothetical protein